MQNDRVAMQSSQKHSLSQIVYEFVVSGKEDGKLGRSYNTKNKSNYSS